MHCGIASMRLGYLANSGRIEGSMGLAHGEKRVGETFLANGRRWSMPRIDPYVITQGKDLFDDTFNELLVVSSCKVGPSY